MTTPPQLAPSHPAPALVPAVIARVLQVAASCPDGAPVGSAVARVLEVLLDLEPGAAVGLRTAGFAQPIWRSHATGDVGPLDGERLFRLAHEVTAPLPIETPGTLHFACDRFERTGAERLRPCLEQAAATLSLLLRVLEPPPSDIPPSTDRPVDSTRDPFVHTQGAQVQQLQKLATMGQTASQIVHEMNNPLTAIVAYSDFLARRMRERGDERDFDRVQRIQEAADRLQRFCRDLTTYSQPDHGDRAPVDLHGVIDRAMGFCIHTLRSHDIDVERVYRDIPLVRGRENSLVQVFVNLFTNAGHAMAAEGGTLRIETRQREGTVVVEVHDEGHGIDEDDVLRVFDTYFTTKARGEGVGLGLSIVRRIVRGHGGTIRAHNREPRGCTFVVELPISA